MDPTDRMTVRASVREGLKEVVFLAGLAKCPLRKSTSGVGPMNPIPWYPRSPQEYVSCDFLQKPGSIQVPGSVVLPGYIST